MHIPQMFTSRPPDSNFASGSDDDRKQGDKPTLRLGMIGFNDQQRAHIKGMVKLLLHQTSDWEIGDFEKADARLVCGSHAHLSSTAQASQNDNLKVLAGNKAEKSMTLSLRSMNRPIAFSLPVADPNIEPGLTCDVASPASIHRLLMQFERCLWIRMTQFVLGKHLTRREPDLKATAYHVLHANMLLAVVDLLSFQIGLLPDTDPQNFEDAVWEKRPTQAAAIPPHFFLTDVVKVRWIYAQHSGRDLFPGRYRHKTIYFRQPPKVTSSWLTDEQLSILHELTVRPLNFLQLVDHLGGRHEDLARDLTCLYFAASITTTASKAAHAHGRREKQMGRDLSSPAMGGNAARVSTLVFDSSIAEDSVSPNYPETTVAAQLSPEQR